MATYASGVSGTVVIPATAGGQNLLIRRWDCEIVREVLDGNIFSVGSPQGTHLNARQVYGGMYDLTGTCECVIDSGAIPILTHLQTENVGAVGADVAANQFHLFNIKAAATGGVSKGYTFNGIISNIRIGVERRGESVVTLSFESSGAVITDYTEP